MGKIPLQKVMTEQILQKLRDFYETRWFITEVMRQTCSFSWAKRIKSTCRNPSKGKFR